MKKIKVAFLITEVQDLSGAGGAERFFFDFFIRNNRSEDKAITIYFYTDNSANLTKVSYNQEDNSKLIKFKSYRNKFFKAKTDRINLLSKPTDLIRNVFTFIPLYFSFLKNGIQILHIPLYEKKDYRLIWLMDKLTFFKRPKISLSIVDCRLPYFYFSNDNIHYYSSHVTYAKLFKNIKLDGILSWYQLFKVFAIENNLLKKSTNIYCATSRYSIVDPVECLPKKEKLIVFAGRLDDQKDPEFFLKAIHQLVLKNETNGYTFKIFGKGPLKEKLESFIAHHQLQDYVSIQFNPKMKDELIKSQCFVSTQLYENFPSMSMAEAMACQNVIIAKNVGQTNLFVKEGYNGYLCDENSTLDLERVLNKFMRLDPEQKQTMARNSSELIREVHNFENFKCQFDEYAQQLSVRN